MFHNVFTRRRGVAIATVALGISGMSLAFAGTAGAAPASTIVGSGSNTAYGLMTAESTLYNSSPGCDLAAGTSLPLALDCNTTPYTPGAPGENGLNTAKENPYNDATFQEPAIGSGNGVKELYTAGSASINYARSSATPANSHGTAAQNYIEYAIDGVSWVHFTKLGSTATPSAPVANITLTNLQAVYNNTLACTKSGVHLTMNWECLGATTSAPIDCYVAQTGSGTEKTWAAAVVGGVDAAPCLTNEKGATGTTYPHAGIFENEVSQFAKNSDAKDAIFYFSFGKFSAQCKLGKCPGAKTDTAALGQINSITPSKATIQGAGGGVPGTFPVLRYLSNVYNNSTASGAGSFGPAGQATLNLVSEYGFLCKPLTVSDIDPLTGVNYRAEIEANITAQGFFPIDTSSAHPFSEGSLANPAVITDANYQTADPTYTSSNPSGFCLSVNG
jgi:hypothetical protein